MSPAVMLATTVLVPAVTAALVFVAGRWALRRVGNSDDGIVASLALSTGYAAGHASIAWPAFPPIDITDRVIWLAFVSLLAGLLASLTRREWLRWANRIGLAAVVVVAVIGPIYQLTSQTWVGACWMLGLGLALVAARANLDRLAARLVPATFGIPLVVAALGSAIALAASGSIVLGRLATAFATALAAIVGLGRGVRIQCGFAAPSCAVLGALLIEGYAYVPSGLPGPSAVLLAAAPVALWTARAAALARRPPWLVTVVVTVVVAAPIIAALALVVVNLPPSDEETGLGTETWKSGRASATLIDSLPVVPAYHLRNPR